MADTYRTPLLPFPPKRQQQFWSKVKKKSADECWEWQGGRTDRNYGTLDIRRKSVRAHRVAFVLTFNMEAENVLHHCDNPPCCNPAHLYEGTYRDNAQDKQRRGRSPWIMYTTGEDCPSAKLTGEQVDYIRLHHCLKPSNSAALAARFGVARRTVIDVARGRSWQSRPWPVLSSPP